MIAKWSKYHYFFSLQVKYCRFSLIVASSALLIAAAGGCARNAKSNDAEEQRRAVQADEVNTSTSFASKSTQGSKQENANNDKPKKHELTKAEKVFKEALGHMSSKTDRQKDILKAYQGFTKAKEMGYEFAEVALAHLCWTLTDKDIKALEAAGVSSPKQGNGYSWYPYVKPMPEWITRSRLAKFEQGLYQLTLHWKERNEEGLILIIQAAEEGLPLAKSFLKSNFSDTYGLSVSETLPLVCRTLSSGGETLAAYQQLCEFEIMKEFYRSIGAQDD